MTITLILGGARSGKSSYAQQLASDSGKPVIFIATAESRDAEMAERIALHRASRPSDWITLETPRHIASCLTAHLRQHPPGQPAIVLMDCLTLLASNCLCALAEPYTQEEADATIIQEINDLLQCVRYHPLHLIIISNEVGLGLIPPYPLGRVYRDSLGRANQHLATQADSVIFMVAGIPWQIKPTRP